MPALSYLGHCQSSDFSQITFLQCIFICLPNAFQQGASVCIFKFTQTQLFTLVDHHTSLQLFCCLKIYISLDYPKTQSSPHIYMRSMCVSMFYYGVSMNLKQILKVVQYSLASGSKLESGYKNAIQTFCHTSAIQAHINTPLRKEQH